MWDTSLTAGERQEWYSIDEGQVCVSVMGLQLAASAVCRKKTWQVKMFSGLGTRSKKAKEREAKKEEKGEVQVTNITEENMKSAFPVLLLYKSFLCLTDSCSTAEVTHIASLLFKQRKSPIKMSWVYFSTFCSGSFIDWKGRHRVVCSAVKQYGPFKYILLAQLLSENVSNHRYQTYSRDSRDLLIHPSTLEAVQGGHFLCGS